MKLHQLRNATIVVETEKHRILVDPMLGAKGTLPPFSYLRYKTRKNPLVELPGCAQEQLQNIEICLLTHSQAFGVRPLQHTDHLDKAGEKLLKERDISIVTGRKDASYLRKHGLRVALELDHWKPEDFLDGRITAVPAEHGRDFMKKFMANGVGFHLELPGEPSLYIAGDTVYTADVDRALRELQPDVCVMASGSARLDIGAPILMTPDELIHFTKNAPGRVMANHLEALNHCPTSRNSLRDLLAQQGLAEKVDIPLDGETVEYPARE